MTYLTNSSNAIEVRPLAYSWPEVERVTRAAMRSLVYFLCGLLGVYFYYRIKNLHPIRFLLLEVLFGALLFNLLTWFFWRLPAGFSGVEQVVALAIGGSVGFWACGLLKPAWRRRLTEKPLILSP